MAGGPETVRLFSFYSDARTGSSAGVKRQQFRKILWVALLLSATFATWSWFKPFEWGADPAARAKVVGVQVTRDERYFWIDAHLKVLPSQSHDLQKPVFLTNAGGVRIEPADTVFGGEKSKGTTDLWFKFWIEENQIEGPLVLHLNDGDLLIRSRGGVPELDNKRSKYFTTHRW